MTELVTLPNTRPLIGAGVPSVVIGANGDVYIDTDTGAIYSKQAGAWVKVPGTGVQYATNNGGTWDAANTTSFVTGASAASGALMGGSLTTMRAKRVRFGRPFTKPNVEVSTDQVTWFDLHVFYDGTTYCMPCLKDDGNLNYSSGFFLKPVNTTDIDIQFCRYAALANDDVPIVNWPSTWYWRVTAEPAT